MGRAYIVQHESIENIADAIRHRNGTNDTYTLQQMPAAIRGAGVCEIIRSSRPIELCGLGWVGDIFPEIIYEPEVAE